jgi:hypothetical protein
MTPGEPRCALRISPNPAAAPWQAESRIFHVILPMPKWNLVRLELARTPEFPEGSASRAYLLRVPLDAGGRIDEAALAARPALATVRRFWPNEPDQSGYLVRNGKGWVFSYAPGEDDDEAVYRLDGHVLCLGEYVTIAEPCGARHPFRVVRAQPDGVGGA